MEQHTCPTCTRPLSSVLSSCTVCRENDPAWVQEQEDRAREMFEPDPPEPDY